jgi:small subunit ribosomal protein S9
VSKPLVQSTGRRKEAVARVRLRPSEGDAEATITINGRDWVDFFPNPTHRMILQEPLKLTQLEESYDVDVTAVRLGIARALIELDPELRPTLKRAGFLTRDDRKKESKKYGLKKARKAPQYSKR